VLLGALLLVAPLLLLNLTVSLCGRSAIFPLSPFFVGDKARALVAYARHRARCLLREHEPIWPLAAAAGRRHRLPPGLLEAVIEVESGGRPHRISSAGAMGPAQLMPGTARLLAVDDPFDPRQSVEGAARYLALQLRRFGQTRLAIAAYNAGPGAVHGHVPRNGETERYVARVMAELRRRGALAAAR